MKRRLIVRSALLFLLLAAAACNDSLREHGGDLPVREVTVDLDGAVLDENDFALTGNPYTGKSYVLSGSTVYAITEDNRLADETAEMTAGVEARFLTAKIVKLYFDSDGKGTVLVYKEAAADEEESRLVFVYKRDGRVTYSSISEQEGGGIGWDDKVIYINARIFYASGGKLISADLSTRESRIITDLEPEDLFCADEESVYVYRLAGLETERQSGPLNVGITAISAPYSTEHPYAGDLVEYDYTGREVSVIDFSSVFFYRQCGSQKEPEDPYSDPGAVSIRKFNEYLILWIEDGIDNLRSVYFVKDNMFYYKTESARKFSYIKSDRELLLSAEIGIQSLFLKYALYP